MAERFYVDFHILQTLPPSNVNRDDMGSPKTAVYGGVTRARVSSQAWKRAMRIRFREEALFPPELLGERTKRIVGKVAEKIRVLNPGADAEKLAADALKKAGLNIKSAEKGTDALFFMSDRQAEALAALAAAKETDAKRFKAALKDAPSVDIALFGRMVANDPSLNYDAAAQVAHSISTHAIQNEYDYFTAVDDRSPEDSAGAAHLGTVEFNSSTLYRYATVNVGELAAQLGAEAAHTVRGFAEAFLRSMPTGKQNTFANRTLPFMAYVAIRRDQPINLVGAFENPVRAGESGGYEAASEARFVEYARNVYRNFAREPELALGVSMRGSFDKLPNTIALSADNLLDTLEKEAAERLDGGKGSV